MSKNQKQIFTAAYSELECDDVDRFFTVKAINRFISLVDLPKSGLSRTVFFRISPDEGLKRHCFKKIMFLVF